MCKRNKNKMTGVNSRFASVSESEILKIQQDAVPQNTKTATKFGMKVFRRKRRLKGPGKRGHIVAHDVSWAAQTGKHLLRTQNVSEQNQKHLCPGHKICVRNKFCARGQTGKHLCRGKRGHIVAEIVADTNVSPFARARNICCGHKFCVQDTVSDFVQKHSVSTTNIPQFAQPKKQHGQQCIRNNVSSFTRALIYCKPVFYRSLRIRACFVLLARFPRKNWEVN